MEVDCVPNRFLTSACIKILMNSHLYFVNMCVLLNAGTKCCFLEHYKTKLAA